jgi:hypothetical protein
MEYKIIKTITENHLVKYSAYVEADTPEEAEDKAMEQDEELEWSEDYDEILDITTRSFEPEKE